MANANKRGSAFVDDDGANKKSFEQSECDEKDLFKKQLQHKKAKLKNMSKEEMKEYQLKQRREGLSHLMDEVIDLIGKQGFQIFKVVVQNYKKSVSDQNSIDELVDGLILAFYRTYSDRPLPVSQLIPPKKQRSIFDDYFEDDFEPKRDMLLKLQHYIVSNNKVHQE